MMGMHFITLKKLIPRPTFPDFYHLGAVIFAEQLLDEVEE